MPPRSKAMKTLAFASGSEAGKLYLVLVHTAEPPGVDEWRAYVTEVEATLALATSMVHAFVATDGGGPNASQRNELARVFAQDSYGSHTHVFTNSAFVRGIVTAFHWIARARAVAHRPDEFANVCTSASLNASRILTDLIGVAQGLPRNEVLQQIEKASQRPRGSMRSSPRRSQGS